MMEMIQTYQGYFQADGRFVPDTLLMKIPTNRRAIVNVLDDEIVETKAQKQRKAFEEFTSAILKAEPLSAEFDEIIKQGISVQGELKL